MENINGSLKAGRSRINEKKYIEMACGEHINIMRNDIIDLVK